MNASTSALAADKAQSATILSMPAMRELDLGVSGRVSVDDLAAALHRAGVTHLDLMDFEQYRARHL